MRTLRCFLAGMTVLGAGCQNPSSNDPADSIMTREVWPIDKVPRNGGDVRLLLSEGTYGPPVDHLKIIHSDPNIRNIRWVATGKAHEYALTAYIQPKLFGSPIVEFTDKSQSPTIRYKVFAFYPNRPAQHVHMLDLGRVAVDGKTISRSLDFPPCEPGQVLIEGGGLAEGLETHPDAKGKLLAAWGPSADAVLQSRINGSRAVPGGISYGAVYSKTKIEADDCEVYVARAYIDGPLMVKPERPKITKEMMTQPGWQTVAFFKYKSGLGKPPTLADKRFRIIRSSDRYQLQAMPSQITKESCCRICLELGPNADHYLWVDVEGRTNPDAVLETP